MATPAEPKRLSARAVARNSYLGFVNDLLRIPRRKGVRRAADESSGEPESNPGSKPRGGRGVEQHGDRGVGRPD